jgi:hypothetical protein
VFFLASVLISGAGLGLVFGILMSVWIWRTRPSRTVPEYRRSAPDVFGTYPSALPPVQLDNGWRRDRLRRSLDGRRRLAL